MKLFDEFAFAPDRGATYRRVWRKFKAVVASCAFVDFGTGARPRTAEDEGLLLSYAWEDAQIAFSGQGDSILTGAVLGLWSALRTEEHDLFARVIREAFKRAEAATSPDVVRRYLSRFRLQPPRLPDGNPFNTGSILPTSGPTLRDWAADQGQDPAEVEEEWYWLAVGDRDQSRGSGSAPPTKGTKRRARLRVVTKEGK